ncbi:unnamed protein product [Rangifer tarandus platyrhynchus]|uniref:Uncharacterized protein n=1 Tax=Rangifer tarandus platyrhynchus TaxID=3082113 RepID=A0ABN8ZFG1_RANTA|nr:unnamed protein product [Rangifer tarandus platyrhynchus]
MRTASGAAGCPRPAPARPSQAPQALQPFLLHVTAPHWAEGYSFSGGAWPGAAEVAETRGGLEGVGGGHRWCRCREGDGCPLCRQSVRYTLGQQRPEEVIVHEQQSRLRPQAVCEQGRASHC